MLGHPTRYRWGSFTWGTQVPPYTRRASVDGTAVVLNTDLAVTVDGVAGNAQLARAASVDATTLGETDLAVAVDFAPTLLPTDDWLRYATSPIILVELRLPGGTVYVSGRDYLLEGTEWVGRLVSTGQILRTLNGGSDDLQITLDDTAERGTRFRTLFLANAPEGSGVTVYLTLDGETVRQRLPVFEGRVERVSRLTPSEVVLDVVRTDLVDDRVLGRVVTTATHPNAPPKTLSRMIPMVFGVVQAHEGLVVDTDAVSELAAALTYTETGGLLLRTPDEFPSTGTCVIGEEQITWTSKVGSELLGLTRGVGGTAAVDHAPDEEVREVGPFQVLFSDHALGSLTNVRILNRKGNLAEPVPLPAAIDTTTGLVSWNELPRTRSTGNPKFQRVHFSLAGAGDTATNSLRAARESASYATFLQADIVSGTQAQWLTSVAGLGEPGDLLRTWIAVVFDPTTLTNASVQIGTGTLYSQAMTLVPTDTMPPDVARKDERVGDRMYAVDNNTAPVTLPDVVEKHQPDQILQVGLWFERQMAGRCIDRFNEDTYSASAVLTVVEFTLVGGEAQYKLSAPPAADGKTAVSAELVAVAGWDLTPYSAPMEIWLSDSRSTPQVPVIGPIPMGALQGVETFRLAFDPLLLGATGKLEDLDEFVWHVAPSQGAVGGAVVAGLWVLRDLRIEVTYQQAPPVNVDIDDRKTVTNCFEVTGMVNGDWGFFGDAARGGTVSLPSLGSTLRVLEVFYVVEHRPYDELASMTPRVFADVVGLVPGGNPADVSEAIITGAPPLGMGLAAANVSSSHYVPARASLAGDGVRVDFALYRQISAVALLREIAEQADLRQTWVDRAHRLVRKVNAASLPAAQRTLTSDDVLDPPDLALARTALGATRTRVEGKYRWHAPENATSEAVEVVDAAAEAIFGRLLEPRELRLVRDTATATLVVTRDLARRATPRWVVSFEVPLLGLEIGYGDVVALTHPDFTFTVGEVTEVTLQTSGLIRVQVTVVVWSV